MSVEKERRAGGPRVPLHTLVEIGAGEGGSAAFEAEAIDVTTAGMHLKTAYLPEIGEPLICRFEGAGTEVIVHGEVAWRTEDNYGGDFGVRFLEMDQESLDALRLVAGESVDHADTPDESEPPGETISHAVKGSRVRLHIEGLGSPMKARVREGTQSDVMVGSNLEFLRVGRTVDIENVEADINRPARIERISVEVEPKSRIPQLVVVLRYLDVAEDEAPALETKYAADEEEEEEVENDPDEVQAAGEYDEEAYNEEAYEDEEYDEDAEDGLEGRKEGAASVVWNKFKQVGPKFAVVGAMAKQWGGKAKDVMGDAVVAAKNKASEKVKERQQAKAPRRTTAPPPKGALRGDGTRESSSADEDPVEPPKTKTAKRMGKALSKRAAFIALAGVLITVVSISFAHNAYQSFGEKTAEDESSDALGTDALALANDEDPGDPGDPPIVPGSMGFDSAPGGKLVANVPLFGPTPMSTAAPMAPMAATALPAVAAVAAVGAAPPEDLGSDEGSTQDGDSDEVAMDDSDGDEDSAGSTKKASQTFSRGRVNNPVVMTLRMNRNIKEVRGVPRSDGFVIDVVGARSTEPAAGLRRQDSRIASSRIVNKGSNAQFTMRFNGSAPGYRVQADGSTLRILLDGGEKKTAATTPANKGKKRR